MLSSSLLETLINGLQSSTVDNQHFPSELGKRGYDGVPQPVQHGAELLGPLDRHNSKEEPVIVKGGMPPDWVCERAVANHVRGHETRPGGGGGVGSPYDDN